MSDPRLVKKVYNLHLALYRELNDIHIFLAHTLPILVETTARFQTMKTKSDKTFLVPSRQGKKGLARRTPQEVSKIIQRFASRDLHANLLVACVSRSESLLNDVLRAFLTKYPTKLTVGLKGGDSSKSVPIAVVIAAKDIDEVLSSIIDTRLQGVFYAEPKEYLSYFESITGVKLPEESFLKFAEIKATRDLVIHNNGLSNELYARKAGTLARAENGEPVEIDEVYFSAAISTMKSISSEIEKQVRASHAKA
ncbi:MAG: hypothetical protein WC736_12380 [Gallionella sp.]|jgi:hypothetical protein